MQAAWLQERIAELQSRLDREQADATAAAAALQTVQAHVRSLEQARDALQRRVAAAEEQAQRLQKELSDGKVAPLHPIVFSQDALFGPEVSPAQPLVVCASPYSAFKGWTLGKLMLCLVLTLLQRHDGVQ